MSYFPDDQDLMWRIEQQDQTALAALYERYGKPIYSLAYRIVQDTTLAEEITQDTFLKIWRFSAKWDARKGQLSSWLLTVTRYTAIDRLRQERRQATPNPTSLDLETTLIGESGSLPAADSRLLHTLLLQLPALQAQAIELAFFQGMTHRELAEALDLPLGTVKTRVRLGLQKLKVLWEDSLE